MIPIVSGASGASSASRASSASGASRASSASGASVSTTTSAQASSADAQTASSANAEQVKSVVNYITLAGPLPENPFTFDDGVVLKTEEELKKMDIDSLMKFSSTISTSIGLETSTLLANQNIQGMYFILKQLSQSTIDGLDTQITVNTSLITSYTQYEDYLNGVSTAYASTIYTYDLDIASQLKAINEYNSTLSSYTSNYNLSVSSIEKENSTFAAAATAYSSIYYTYLGYQSQYDDITRQLADVNITLSAAVLREQTSYKSLKESTATWLTTSGYLSSLYTDRTNINSSLTQYIIDESQTYLKYISSISALSTISSMYSAAVANENYALSLSTTTQKVTDYANALERFQAADLLYNNSVPITAGVNPPSGSIQGNSALWAARTMAYQQLQTTQADKIAAENATATLQNLAGLANTSAYQTMLLGYDAEILSYAVVEQNFAKYALSSLEAVKTFSSIYEQSILDINFYNQQFSTYSSLYVSSLLGASSLLKYSIVELSTITADNMLYNAISWSISSLNQQYSTAIYDYNSILATSSLFAAQYYSSMINVDMYTRYYTSTQTAVDMMTAQLYGPGGLINIYNTTMFINSSILNKEIINTKSYDAQLKGFITLQDESMCQYRETYCRSQRDIYQTNYESNVFAAVLLAQNITLSNQARAAPGTTVPPTAADLTVPAVSNTYAQLNSINTFLNVFSDMYEVYDTQALNVNNISTSIGYEATTWSTLDSYTSAKYFNTPIISSIETLVTKSCDALTAVKSSTTALLNIYDATQSIIDTKKISLLSNFTTFFTGADIERQNTEISSFIILSIADAIAMLRSQGINV